MGIAINRVILGGNLTRDPEQEFLPSGTEKSRFSIAQNETWKDRNTGQKKERVHFFECEAFGATASAINEYFSKGKPIIVEGKNDYQSWETQDGSKRSVVRVKVQSFHFVPDGKRDDSDGGSRRNKRDEVEINEEDFDDIPF